MFQKRFIEAMKEHHNIKRKHAHFRGMLIRFAWHSAKRFSSRAMKEFELTSQERTNKVRNATSLVAHTTIAKAHIASAVRIVLRTRPKVACGQRTVCFTRPGS